MRREKQQLTCIRWWRGTLALLGCFLLFVTPTLAVTTVTNTVQVTSDGGANTSHAAVTTVVDGVTVEDWSTTTNSSSTISYTHQYNSDVEETLGTTSLTSHDTASEHDQLVELIAHLQTLIALYVALLSHQ